jgi:hypothetical protein
MDKRLKEILINIIHRDNRLDQTRLHLIEDIVNIDNSNFELDSLYNVIKYASESEDEMFNALLEFYNINKVHALLLTTLFNADTKDKKLDFIETLTENELIFETFKEASIHLTSILEDVKEYQRLAKHESYNEILDKALDTKLKTLQDNSLLLSVLDTIKNHPELEKYILDSYSNNQFLSKNELINAVDNLNILNEKSVVMLWGGWYGSILIPKLSDKVSKMYNIDIDDECLKIAKNYLMKDYNNVEYFQGDVFETYRDIYLDVNLIINTSCEHMPPMKEWKWFGAGALENDADTSIFRTPKLPNECYFAFQSNNMFDVEGHINCVNSLEEFESQLPTRAKVLYRKEIKDTRGTRYMLIGQFTPL